MGRIQTTLAKLTLGQIGTSARQLWVLLTQDAPLARRPPGVRRGGTPRQSRTLEIEWFEERMDNY
jgi:hypothetical protein